MSPSDDECSCGCGRPAEKGSAFATRSCARYYARNHVCAPTAPPRPKHDTCACGGAMRWGNSRCAKCTYSAPVTVDLRAIARALAPVERYPLETTSADVCLPGPTVEAKRDVRSASTGMTRVECPTCGGQAWQEPPLLVNGVERVVVRCRACRSAPRMCPACGVRPQRKRGRRWASYCSECWKQRASVEAKKEEELPDMATVATNGKATIACPYCKKSFTPIRSTQVTCGATACQKKHVCHLSKHPKYKQGVAKPVPVSVVPPVACQSTPMETPPPVPALVPVNHDAITAAVDALAAIPADKRAGVLAVVEAREKAAAMLAELRSAREKAAAMLAELRS